ncbi:MAG: hypothetical protein MR997_06085 [Bacteroidales bacterium]|nr:hypothetical protein [Bacteroidales bacterium]
MNIPVRQLQLNSQFHLQVVLWMALEKKLPQLELFPQKEGSNFENYKTNAYLQAIKQQN